MTHAYAAQVSAMIVLTLTMCVLGVLERVREVRERRIPLQSISRAIVTATTLEHTSRVDNFNNLLQVPILFYVLCLMLAQVNVVTTTLQVLLWLYVGLRLVHSLIHITANNVLRRFQAWMASNVVLAIAWLIFMIHALLPTTASH